VQVDPIKPLLKPPGTKRLKLKCDVLLSNLAFKFNLRRYITGTEVLDVVRQRQVWVRRTKKRLKRVVDVSYWRTGKPKHQIREEAIRRQGLTIVPFTPQLKRNHRQP